MSKLRNIILGTTAAAMLAGASLAPSFAQDKSKPAQKAKTEQVRNAGDLSGELSMILNKYMGHDENGIYVTLKDSVTASRDFRNDYFNNSWNEFSCINNAATALNALMSPANSQNSRNQEGRDHYFRRNEISQAKDKDGNYRFLQLPETKRNFAENWVAYNLENEDKFKLNIPDDLNDYHSGKLYLRPQDAQRFLDAAKGFARVTGLQLHDQARLDSLRDFYEGWVLDLKRDNEDLAERNEHLGSLISRVGVYPSAGVTSMGGEAMPNYGVVGGITNGFKLGFKYMGEFKEQTPESKFTETKRHPVLPVTGFSETSTQSETKMHGWEASAHVPLSREFYLIGAVGQLNKTVLENNVSTTWFENNGNKFDVQRTPYQIDNTTKAMAYGGGFGLEISPMYFTATVTASPSFEPTYNISAGFNIAKLFGTK